jgi:hypothetical protein
VKPPFELADIITRFGKSFVEQAHPNPFQQRVLNAITQCRTSELGGHRQTCDCCGKTRISYNSCRNRNCPKCQASKQAVWVDELLSSTLEVKHYHIVFTTAHELNAICQLNSAWFYNLLFEAVWQTLRTFGYSHFGVESGAICVLHTWGQNLSLHPHVHCIVPAAGLSLAGNLKHVGANGKYLFPVRMLSQVFRAKMMTAIKKKMTTLGVLDNYHAVIEKAWAKPWVVFCEPSLVRAEHVVKYLGQYTHRVAITNQRIINVNEHGVCFLHKDYAHGARQKTMYLEGGEFLRRFCQHILPLRFVKIRRYGIYSARHKAVIKDKYAIAQAKLRKSEPIRQKLLRITGLDIFICPFCKNGTMRNVEEITRIRSPTTLYAILNTLPIR